MKRYRIVCYELARVRNIYRVEAESEQDARDQILSEDQPDPLESEISEYLGDEDITVISEA